MKTLKILGIDPGLKKIGWALIEGNGDCRLIKLGCFKPQKNFQEILEIFSFFEKMIKNTKPQLIALEKIIFSKNKKTALEIAKIIGLIELLALKNKISIIEIGPTQLKKLIAGDGTAKKEALRKILEISFKKNFQNFLDDSLDALALTIGAFYLTKQKKLLQS